ncbi:hypothetical protein [Flavobacterium aquicola]|uniref:Uncharacterized protein n=1 Tax=Flavobacterium aquicola TaxID=1682742 RepID=A0A3E0DX14_9FLAO|nr:hypothetical protein [Flavobacterium aquicola]REG90495.1 hypothetical protein C8P67_12022 [Flavobacterium aquicola]
MSKITFDDYKKAIKTQYEKKKAEDDTGILKNPSPAQLRNLCLIFFDKSLSNNDKTTMKLFFNVKEEESLRRAIENCEISRFRPIRSFLLGGINSENKARIEMAAIIVGLTPRPYEKFCQNTGVIEIVDENFSENELEEVGVVPKKNIEVVTKKEGIITDKGGDKKIMTIAIVLISLFFTGYMAKNIFFPTKQCMQWQANHYEAVDCLNNQLGIGQLNLIVPVDEPTMKLKKLDSKAEQVFFINDKPVVWYSKENGKIELFNQYGLHPESGKPLRPITNYIIEKYQLRSKE